MICDKWLHVYGNKLGTGVNCEWVDGIRENVRGEWLYKPESDTTICSACGKVVFNHLEEGCVDASVYKFCPICGADMRGNKL